MMMAMQLSPNHAPAMIAVAAEYAVLPDRNISSHALHAVNVIGKCNDSGESLGATIVGELDAQAAGFETCTRTISMAHVQY